MLQANPFGLSLVGAAPHSHSQSFRRRGSGWDLAVAACFPSQLCRTFDGRNRHGVSAKRPKQAPRQSKRERKAEGDFASDCNKKVQISYIFSQCSVKICLQSLLIRTWASVLMPEEDLASELSISLGFISL